jgi:hypothetical protein
MNLCMCDTISVVQTDTGALVQTFFLLEPVHHTAPSFVLQIAIMLTLRTVTYGSTAERSRRRKVTGTGTA